MSLKISLLTLILSSFAWAATSSETHHFHVLGKVKYRCYAGYSGKKAFDEMTKQPCDNKSYDQTVIDKIVSIEIKNEPNPEDSKDLVGDWDGKFEFKGRKFEIAMTLFKEMSPLTYRLRLVAFDNEPTSRKSAVFSEIKKMQEMNPLIFEYTSAGKKEEISFWTQVGPVLKK